MRLRRNWEGEKALPNMPGVLSDDPKIFKESLKNTFQNNNPIHIEIGMGKGDFVIGMAKAHPEINFIGIELSQTVLFIATKKNAKKPLPNLRFLSIDAEKLLDYFDENSLDRIYLNFSDPWPKARHAKRRLTYRDKLNIYKKILKPGGAIHFKTDQLPLFEFSIEELLISGYSISKITYDLHHSGFQGNIMTEYERRFTNLGDPINRLEAYYG